jgi:Flp pilus assembly protein TadG
MSSLRRAGANTREEDGATLIETSLVLPPFFFLLFGLFNVSLLLFGFCNASYAANAAARYASLGSATSGNPATVVSVESVITASLYIPGGSAPALTVDYSRGTGNFVGQPVVVGISYQAAPGMAWRSFVVSAQAVRYITH